jgi:hypothetical protein
MHNLYEVTFSTGERNNSGTWFGSTSTSFMTTQVNALHNIQAREMVESMYGGPSHCQVHSVYEVR